MTTSKHSQPIDASTWTQIDHIEPGKTLVLTRSAVFHNKALEDPTVTIITNGWPILLDESCPFPPKALIK